jgi:ubiquinone biosynthesis protein
VRTEPLGCASLAQVYYVVLKSGRPAVVKIQRPGVQAAMLDDMALLAALVKRLAKRMPDLNDVLDLEAMLDVVFSSMRPELDFTLEAENMDAFRDRVGDFDTLNIPEVLYATPRVLVQSMAPGMSIRDVNREDFPEEQREAIGRDLMSFMFWGYFVDRKFHADPHPGNVFISPEGEANLIDWGMVGKVDLNLSIALSVVLLSMGLNDGTTLARTWIEMGRATKRADIAGFINDMGRFVPGIAGQSLERFNFGVQLTSILKFSSKRGIATSPMVAILGKSFANAEGSIRYLAPGLSITDIFEDEFKLISQEIAREMLGRDAMARSAAQAFLMGFNGPGQLRSVMADMANRDTTMRLGEDMSLRSRHEDRADARARQWRRAALGAAAAGLWLDRRRRSTLP